MKNGVGLIVLSKEVMCVKRFFLRCPIDMNQGLEIALVIPLGIMKGTNELALHRGVSIAMHVIQRPAQLSTVLCNLFARNVMLPRFVFG